MVPCGMVDIGSVLPRAAEAQIGLAGPEVGVIFSGLIFPLPVRSDILGRQFRLSRTRNRAGRWRYKLEVDQPAGGSA